MHRDPRITTAIHESQDEPYDEVIIMKLRILRASTFLIAFILALLCGAARAQAPLATDLQLMATGDVLAVAAQADGKLVVAGDFTRAGTAVRNHLARFNADGSLDASWNPDVNGVVHALAVNGNSIYIGGEFTTAGGAARANLAAIDASSGLATPWNPGANGAVRALLFDGTVVFAGGSFTSAGGQPRNRLAALSPSNGTANGWNPGANGDVLTLAFNNNELYAGGAFTMLGGATRNRAGAVNKSNGALLAWNPDVNGDVKTIVRAGSNYFLGGAFSLVSGTTRHSAALVTSAGALLGWNPDVTGDVRGIALSGSSVYLGGAFSAVGGNARANLAAVDNSQGAPLVWNPSADAPVSALLISGQSVLAAGSFGAVGTQSRVGYAAIDASGNALSGTPHVGNPGRVFALETQSDGKIYAGGDFALATSGTQRLARRNLLRLNTDGSLDTNWNAGTNYHVYALLEQNGTLYVGGAFTAAGGQLRNRAAAFDTAAGALAAWNPDAAGAVMALAAANGLIYAGGEFETIAGQPRGRIAALDAATGAATAWNPTADGAVVALASNATAIYAGGYFNTIAGQVRTGVAALDAAGNATAFNAHADGNVLALMVANGSLYAGGAYGHIGGQVRNGLAALDPVTGNASPWSPQTGGVLALSHDPWLVYAGGQFNSAGGQPRNNVAAVNAGNAQAVTWNPGTNGSVFAVLARGDVAVLGGSFTQAGGAPRDGLAVLPAVNATTFNIGVQRYGNGAGTVTSSPSGVNCGADCASGFQAGTVVTLTATPAPGSAFAGWQGPCSGTGSCTIFVTEPVNVAALFGSSFTLAASADYQGGTGTVTSSPSGIDCGNTCYATYSAGQTVTMTPHAGADSYFTGWSGDCAGTGSCTVTMNNDRTVVGAFAKKPLLSVTPSGEGSVTSSPAGISCGTDASNECDRYLAPGTVVTLTATPGPLSYFVGWSGACSGTGPCVITMNANRTAIAAFATKPQLAVGLAGLGSVVSSPSGINCGADCEERYAPGTVVTLTATPATGYGFTGWTGACSGTAPCTITIVPGTNPVATAQFEARSLTVTLGTGGGTVTSSPAGIDCGATCGALFAPGTVVALTATPLPGYTFAGWSSDCSGTQGCTVTMNGNKSVGAMFIGKSISLFHAGNGQGDVSFQPGGVVCKANCAVDFPAGTVVTLQAVAAPGSRFAGWSGACGGTGDCIVTMDQQRDITARFEDIVSARSDVTGDGTSDVIWYHSGVYGLIGMNAHGLSLDPAYIIDAQTDANWKVAGIGDLNGDGYADVVWQNGVTGEVYGLLMKGSTVLAEGTIYTEPNTSWKIEQVADIDGDGQADLVWKNQGTGQVYILKMNGLSIVAGQVVYVEPNLNWKIVAAGDMNGDGKADLLWRNAVTGDVFAMLMDGFTVLASGVIYSEPDLNWKIVGLADYNGDGKADILWQNAATGAVFQMQMNGMTVAASAVIYTEPNTQWKIVALGDYNGDAKADILWHNAATGQVFMMLMNGFAVTASAIVYSEPDLQWGIVGP